jgi:hypothetical protein
MINLLKVNPLFGRNILVGSADDTVILRPTSNENNSDFEKAAQIDSSLRRTTSFGASAAKERKSMWNSFMSTSSPSGKVSIAK